MDLLMPILARAHVLIERWRVQNPATLEGAVGRGVVREGAIELGEIFSEERQRLHEEFAGRRKNARRSQNQGRL
jgi:hypothetical protein